MKFYDFAAEPGQSREYAEARLRQDRSGEHRMRVEPSILNELVEVLTPHPGGLRRWSVMRAIRAKRDRASRPVPLKFEADVERVFRNSCANWGDVKCANPETALFYRPEGKAGEVWAVDAVRARAWLAGSMPQGG